MVFGCLLYLLVFCFFLFIFFFSLSLSSSLSPFPSCLFFRRSPGVGLFERDAIVSGVVNRTAPAGRISGQPAEETGQIAINVSHFGRNGRAEFIGLYLCYSSGRYCDSGHIQIRRKWRTDRSRFWPCWSSCGDGKWPETKDKRR